MSQTVRLINSCKICAINAFCLVLKHKKLLLWIFENESFVSLLKRDFSDYITLHYYCYIFIITLTDFNTTWGNSRDTQNGPLSNVCNSSSCSSKQDKKTLNMQILQQLINLTDYGISLTLYFAESVLF